MPDSSSPMARRGEDAVRHLELPGRVRRARAHDSGGGAGHPGALSRHRASLPADDRVSRRAGVAVGPESRDPAGGRTVARIMAAGHQGLLRQAQGRAPLRGAGTPRRVVHGPPARAVGVARRARGIGPFRLPDGTVLRKVSPLAGWSTKEVWAYAKAHDIPLLPLYDLGYTSVGCEPCTTLPADPGNERSGRWQGQKLECGIHIQSEG